MLLWMFLACSDKEITTNEDNVSNDIPEETVPQTEDNSETVVEEETVEETEDSEEEIEEEPEVEEIEETFSCEEGRSYWQECTGIPLSPSIPCTEELYTELLLAQTLTCDTFLEAKDELPFCESLGLNCAEDYQGCADVPLDAGDVLSLLEWTDNSTLTDIYDVRERNAALREFFAERGDIRGAFASVYSPITNLAVESIEDEIFTHDIWVRDLVVAFSARYYHNLRASLLSQSTTQSWGRYYELSEDCSVNGLRIAAHGIVVHLIVDLPHTLVDIESSTDQKDDFELFGLALVDATPIIVENLRDDYGIESENFFNGFFLGNWIDAVAGDNATTTFAFQTIRNKAWTNGMWLQDWRATMAEFEIYTSWRTADAILATWDIVQ